VRAVPYLFELSPALSKEIKILTVRKRCTLFMTLLAAFKTLLYRYTCQDNITVGTPIGNRSQLDCEKLMGLFINTLVLCTKTGDDPSFSDLLERVRLLKQDKFNTPVSTLLAQNKSPEDILEMLLSEKDMKIIGKSPCRYLCNCSRERMERNIMTLGKEEIMGMINETTGRRRIAIFAIRNTGFRKRTF